MYNIPVIVNGEYRAMITVSEKDGTYELETVGAALLAKELQSLEGSVSANQDFIMLNVYSKAAGFVAYPEPNTSFAACSFIPLESAQTALRESAVRSPQVSYTLSELVEGLKH